MSLEKSKSIEAGLQVLAPPAEQSNEKLPLTKKIKLIFTNMTVEPIMVLYLLPSVMASLAIQNLNLEKACRVNLKYNETICDHLTMRNSSGYKQEDEIEIQKLVASMNAWKNIIQSIIPAIILMFIGSWSDRNNRRKPCILIPIVGEMCSSACFILCTYFFYQLPMEFNALAESIPPSITGGWFAMFVGIYSYISDITSVESRTLRIGTVTTFQNISQTIGIALSGILFKAIGFYGIFSLALAMYTFALFYGIFTMKEEIKIKEVVNSKKRNPITGFFLDFFNSKHLKETFKVAFKDGKRNRKKRICTIMVLVMVIIGPTHGEMNVVYLFTRYKYKWNEVDFSVYFTFNCVACTIATIFSMSFFTKYLKLDDTLLGIISSVSKVLSAFIYAFAPTPTVFYIGAVVEMLNGTASIAMRSIMSKLVPPDELGKINSLFGVFEALLPLVYGPMYSAMYKATINHLPGAFFLLGGILSIPSVCIFFWLYTEHQKDKLEDEKQEEQNEQMLTIGSTNTTDK